MQYVENSLHCFLVTFLCVTNFSLDILAKDCLLIRHLAGNYHLSQCFSTFVLQGSFCNCLCCSWNPMQWSKCLSYFL